MDKLRIIITGVTGFVGEGVMYECLKHPDVESVLTVSRKPYEGTKHPKLKQLVVRDFMNLSEVQGELVGYNACFYCAGVSSVGMSEAAYTKVTYDTPLAFARTLVELNPGMTLVHVSGASTDGTERSSVMWARVKGKAENALMKLPFKAVYNFRPGLMRPSPSMRNVKGILRAASVLYPVFSRILPNKSSTIEDVGTAMIKCVQRGYEKHVLEVVDINALAKA